MVCMIIVLFKKAVLLLNELTATMSETNETFKFLMYIKILKKSVFKMCQNKRIEPTQIMMYLGSVSVISAQGNRRAMKPLTLMRP